MTGNLAHPLARRRRRDQPDEGERAVAKPFLAFGIRSHGNVRDENTTGACFRGPSEGVGAGGKNRIQVAEQHHRHCEPGPLDQVQHTVVGHSVLEGSLRAGLDDRTIRDRIRERDAQLDDVRAALLQRPKCLQRALDVRMARRYVADQRAAESGGARRSDALSR